MFQRVLICTDFSDSLQRLVNFVPSLAAGGISQIVFLHTVSLEEAPIPRVDTERIDRARDKLSVACRQAPSGVEVKIEVQSGRAIDTILRTAATYESDVIILGTPSRNLLTEKLFGSTTMGLAQRTKIPLFTLRPQLISTYTTEELDLRCRHLFRNLLLPFDNSNAAKYTVEKIKQLSQKKLPSKECIQEILLCWVVEEGGRSELSETEQQTIVSQTIEPIQQSLNAAGLATELEVRRGNPIVEILAVAQESDISAIVLSSDSLGKLLEWSAPSFAGEIMRRSWHSVLYFPPQK
ncbi:MAG: universal stress protein [Leptolyngbyaceae cyanobacterium SU_3_3]|nr:universal stress protein [Leptolyngbyaceae cyanobacterium SU_3_3]NJR52600.1 universal stress protein [Leptolyngbyaceae cyanobacterium CSU_1_3]